MAIDYPACEEPGCEDPGTFNRQVHVFRMIRFKWICKKHRQPDDERVLPEPEDLDDREDPNPDDYERDPYIKDGLYHA